MKQEQIEKIRIAVAEELGCININSVCWRGHKNGVEVKLPNYPSSLDACVEFESAVRTQRDTYIINLHESTESTGCTGFENDTQVSLDELHRAWILTTATPLQRCIAFLKTRNIEIPE